LQILSKTTLEKCNRKLQKEIENYNRNHLQEDSFARKIVCNKIICKKIICRKNHLQEKYLQEKPFAIEIICKKNHFQEKSFARKSFARQIFCKKNHLQEKSFARKIIPTICNGKTIQHSTTVCDGKNHSTKKLKS
jgi:hypothetical protein